MITPLDIENKKFSKQMVNGYSVDEIDDFLDQLTVDYEKLYKENIESKNKIEELNVAKKQAEQIINEAQATAKEAIGSIDNEISMKRKELEDVQKQFDIYKAKMESLLISQLELIKDINKE